MDVAELEKKLLAAARANCPAATVPYAFEKRVLALVTSLHPGGVWEQLARGLWQAVAPCVAIMVLLCAWSLFHPLPEPSGNDLTVDFDRMVLAAADQEQNVESGW